MIRITGAIIILFFVCSVTTAQGQNSMAEQKAMVWSMDDEALEWGACPAFMPESCRIAVLQGNPKQPNTDIFFKMKGNTTVARHWHHSPERMVLVSGEMQVKYDGQDSEVIKTGNYAYGPAERPHEASCLSDEPCILFIAFEDPIDAMPVSEAGK
ncbi:cupin domain-containing protein [Fodinibius salsisoli]